MGFDLLLYQRGVLTGGPSVQDILRCNELTAPFGLKLTEGQALELLETRTLSLRETGRIELGGGIIDQLIEAFCDSPFLCQENYAPTLQSLIELFYQYKNETSDQLRDEELIRAMKEAFDGICQGSLALLAERELDRLAREIRGCSNEVEEDGKS